MYHFDRFLLSEAWILSLFWKVSSTTIHTIGNKAELGVYGGENGDGDELCPEMNIERFSEKYMLGGKAVDLIREKYPNRRIGGVC